MGVLSVFVILEQKVTQMFQSSEVIVEMDEQQMPMLQWVYCQQMSANANASMGG